MSARPLIRMISFFALSVALATPGAAHAQTAVDATIDRAVAAWSKVHTVRAAFEQTVTNPLTGANVTSTGTFVQQRPNRLAIRFNPPANDQIVSDGASLWVYLPSTAPGQVIKRPATTSTGGMSVPIDITGQFLDQPKVRYNAVDAGTHAVAGHPAHGVTLTPKVAHGGPFATATVWIDDDDSLIRDFTETESSGVQRHVRLTSVDLNPAVDDATFRFSVPRGVKVVDQSR